MNSIVPGRQALPCLAAMSAGESTLVCFSYPKWSVTPRELKAEFKRFASFIKLSDGPFHFRLTLISPFVCDPPIKLLQ